MDGVDIQKQYITARSYRDLATNPLERHFWAVSCAFWGSWSLARPLAEDRALRNASLVAEHYMEVLND